MLPSFTAADLNHGPTKPPDDKEKTPDLSEGEDSHMTTEPEIRFRFSSMPKNPAVGFLFGSDTQLCDVFLGTKEQKISGRMFAITFNDKGDLVMKTFSNNYTKMKFGEQKWFKRGCFTFTLYPYCKMISVKVAKDLEFKIHVPSRPNFKEQYAVERDSFRERCENALTSMGQLGIAIPTATAQVSGQATASQEQNPNYLLKRKIGSGSFGNVFTARQMPSRAKVASKKFKNSTPEWKTEVDLLKEISHHVSRVLGIPFLGNRQRCLETYSWLHRLLP